jgi:hypothetical protein
MKVDDPDDVQVMTDYCRRFKWIDSDTIKLVNNEGIEKIVDVNKGFDEIAFATVPIFDPKEKRGWAFHYYDMRSTL